MSLTDCLACSGCITSAESVLISSQSHDEFKRILEANRAISEVDEKMVVVVSMSHQPISSFAVKYGIEFQAVAEKLATFLKGMGVDYVFDLTLARHISLIEACHEFEEKSTIKNQAGDKKSPFPILNSICPGWVCYVEKTHGDLIVPFLSRVKSPQQIMGSIIKRTWSGSKSSKMFHVTLMPCYDKKLEASRAQFQIDQHDKDVDLVITPIELEMLFNQDAVSFKGLPRTQLDILHPLFSSNCVVQTHFGSGSGGYTENMVRFTVQSLLKEQLTDDRIQYKTRRNRDFLEVEIIPKEGQNKIVFAVVNGFRNIQTLVQQIKRSKCEYSFVEIMACPGGCLNGGAQLKCEDESKDVKHFDKIESVYKSLGVVEVPVSLENEVMKQIYDEWFSSEELRKQYLWTTFQAVPKTENLLTMNW